MYDERVIEILGFDPKKPEERIGMSAMDVVITIFLEGYNMNSY
mgnify:FL=1